MSRERFQARSKKVQKLGRDGLVEQDLATGEEQRVSQRTADVSFGRERPSERDAAQQGKERSKKARLRAQIAEYQQPSVLTDTPERTEAPSAPEVPTPEQATIERSADDVPLTRAAPDDGKPLAARYKRQVRAAARQHDASRRLTFEQTDNTGLRFEPEKAADDNDGQAEHKARGAENPRSRQHEKPLTNAPHDEGQPRKSERGLDAPQDRFVPEAMRMLGFERERPNAPAPDNQKAAKQRQAAEHTPDAAKPECARLRFEDAQNKNDTPSVATDTPQRRRATHAEQFTRPQRSREGPTRSEWAYNGDAVKARRRLRFEEEQINRDVIEGYRTQIADNEAKLQKAMRMKATLYESFIDGNLSKDEYKDHKM